MKFQKGEIVTIQSISNPQFNGLETEILEVLPLNLRGIQGYSCTIEPNPTLLARGWDESALRKKKPPKEIDWVKMCNLKVLEAV